MKPNIPIITFSLALLVVFDAGQQYYYITSFDLLPANTAISFSELLVNHCIRWCIWLMSSIPFFYLIKAKFRSSEELTLLHPKILISMLLTVVLALSIISLHSIYHQKEVLTLPILTEFFTFFFYQKGLTFLLALIGSAFLIAFYTQEKSLKVQSIEIKELQKTNLTLKRRSTLKEVPHLHIKTGYTFKSIPVDEIIWIQSDDYCVRVHTKTNAYTLRKSLKDLEVKLGNFRFVRIHRSALLNLDYLDQINFSSSTVRLKNKSEVPASKAGMKKLREELAN